MRNKHKIFIYLRLKTMATEKKQTEKPGSTVSKSKNSEEKNAPKIKLRDKKKTWVKTKTEKKLSVQVKRTATRRTIKLDDEDVQHLLLGRKKIFKTPEQLKNLFNTYLLTCLERIKKTELTPVKTENVEEMQDLDADTELENVKAKNKKGGKTTVTNNIVANYEIVEYIKRKTTPSVWGFLIFLGGLSYDTWDSYCENPTFSELCKEIKSYLESLIVEQASKWEYNPQIAQFVLNVHYNRIPKKEVDNNIKGSVFKAEDFIKD